MDQLAANDNQDNVRAYRMFAGLLSTALGVENTYTSSDGNLSNPPNQFQTVDIYRGSVTQGKTYTVGATVSQDAVTVSTPLLIIGAIAVYFLLKG